MVEPRRPTKKFSQEDLRKGRIKKLQPHWPIPDHIKNGERWASFGDRSTYTFRIKEFYLKTLKRIKKREPQIMVVGAGLGLDLVLLKKDVENAGMTPQIDVFSLTKSLFPGVEEIVRTDYSQNVSLEEVGANPKKYVNLIKALQGKYDLVVAFLSAGAHANFPAQNCFFMAMMLAVLGEAHIDISYRNTKGGKDFKEYFPTVFPD